VSRRDGATLKSDYFTLGAFLRGAVTPWRYWRCQSAVSFRSAAFFTLAAKHRLNDRRLGIRRRR